MFSLDDSPDVFSCLLGITGYKNVTGSKVLRMFFECFLNSIRGSQRIIPWKPFFFRVFAI